MKRVGVLAGLALLLAGCGSSSGTLTVGAARTFRLAQFTPTTFEAGKPQQISFTIEQPSGAPLTSYRTGSGPHTGVHLIIVRSDLGAIVHKHPPIGAGRPDHRDRSRSRPPGATASSWTRIPRWPACSGTFSSSGGSTSPARPRRSRCRRSETTVTVGGYRFTLDHPPALHAIRAEFLNAHRHAPRRHSREVHALVRRAGARDLLPRGVARLLPHARLCGRDDRLHERPRPDARHRNVRPSRGSSASEFCFPCRAPGGSSCRPRSTAAFSPLRLRWWCDDRSRHQRLFEGRRCGRDRPPRPQHRVRDRSDLGRPHARAPRRRSRAAGAHARRAGARRFARGRDLLARCFRCARTCAARASRARRSAASVPSCAHALCSPLCSRRSRRSQVGSSRRTCTGAPGSAGTGSNASSGRYTAISCRSQPRSRSSRRRCSPRQSTSSPGCGERFPCCAGCRSASCESPPSSSSSSPRRVLPWRGGSARPRAPPAFS